MQALQGGAAPTGPGGAGGPPPSIQIGGGPVGPQDASDTSDGADTSDVEELLGHAKRYLLQAEDAEQDHPDKETILKCISLIQGLMSSRQKGAESALGVTPAHKAMSRAY